MNCPSWEMVQYQKLGLIELGGKIFPCARACYSFVSFFFFLSIFLCATPFIFPLFSTLSSQEELAAKCFHLCSSKE